VFGAVELKRCGLINWHGDRVGGRVFTVASVKNDSFSVFRSHNFSCP
jgi:hypothetical protein